MATLKQRMHKKNSSGTYDTVHLETSSSLVLRPSGRTVEQDLADYLPKTQASDTPPSTLPFGTLLTGSTIGTNNEKSTKVWTGDAENTPVELVAYNSDGTLPTNQVYFGSYVGDGTRGISARDPMSLTFPFEPKVIWMLGFNYNTSSANIDTFKNSPQLEYSTATAINLSRVTETFESSGAWRNSIQSKYVYHKLSSDRKTYYWYNSTRNTATSVFNTQSNVYWYIAFS